MNFVIEKATIQQAKAKIIFAGPSGAGKTYTALKTARELGDNILVIDTENGTSAKYANEFDFQILRLPDYSLKTYIEALEYCKDKGFDVVIIDSLSHAWVGPGGALEQVDNASKRFSGNKYFAWGEVTPLHNKLITQILSYPSHLIATVRMKMDYILVENDKGKQSPQKVGLGMVQREGIEYEFDIVAEMTVDHMLTVTKTRCFALDGFTAHKPDGKLGQLIKDWLTEGIAPPVWPDGWYPGKEQFFEKARDEFAWSNQDIAAELKRRGFSGYDPAQAATYWRSIEEAISANSPGLEQQSLVDLPADDAPAGYYAE